MKRVLLAIGVQFICSSIFAVTSSSPAPAAPGNPVSQLYASAPAQLTTNGYMAPGEGGPLPVCQPGHNCSGDNRLRQIAGEGGPLPVCQPGHNCSGDNRLREIAGEGGPLPVCQPGHNCSGDNRLRGIDLYEAAAM